MTRTTKNKLQKSWDNKCSEASNAEQKGNDEKSAKLYDRAADYADRLSNHARDEDEAAHWLDIADQQRQKARNLRGEGPPPTSDENTSGVDADSGFKAPETDDDAPIGELFEQPPDDGGFDEVIGQENLIETLEDEIILPLQNPGHFNRLGVSLEKGILLSGPPGNGKTFIASKLSAEANFPFAMISPSKVTSRWVGEASKKIDQLYENAKSNAEEHGGTVVILDEVDSIAPDRAEGRNTTNSEYQMLTELLTTLTEVNSSDYNVVTVATTNVSGELDTALTRSGRFNKQYTVSPPEPQTRIEILEHYLDKLPSEPAWPVDQFDRAEFIKRTSNYVARDVEEVAVEACRLSAVESTRKGEKITPAWRHITGALREIGEGTLVDWNNTPTENDSPDPMTLNDIVGD